jgi:hypothetical protein
MKPDNPDTLYALGMTLQACRATKKLHQHL